MDEHFEACLRFLAGARVDSLDHSRRSLLDHLLGTRALLVAWGARQPVCDAGLFHSVYSTEAFEAAAVSLDRRGEVCGLIGDEAERLAWLFGVMERESFDANLGGAGSPKITNRLTSERIPLSRGEFADLVNLSCANTLEAVPRLPWGQRRRCIGYLARYEPIAMPEASAALREARGAWWQVWR